MGGVPVGRLYEAVPPVAQALLHLGKAKARSSSSLPPMLRSTVGSSLGWLSVPRWDLARTGSTARHGSGDFMLAFSTANIIPHYPKEPTFQQMHLADTHLNPLITATVEATEEAILNALTMATTVVGRDGHRVEAISLTRLSYHPRSPGQVTAENRHPQARGFPHLHFPLMPRYPLRDSLASGGLA